MTNQQLKAIRNELKLSQEAFGKLFGLSSRAIKYYESGEYKVPMTLSMLLNPDTAPDIIKDYLEINE